MRMATFTWPRMQAFLLVVIVLFDHGTVDAAPRPVITPNSVPAKPGLDQADADIGHPSVLESGTNEEIYLESQMKSLFAATAGSRDVVGLGSNTVDENNIKSIMKNLFALTAGSSDVFGQGSITVEENNIKSILKPLLKAAAHEDTFSTSLSPQEVDEAELVSKAEYIFNRRAEMVTDDLQGKAQHVMEDVSDYNSKLHHLGDVEEMIGASCGQGVLSAVHGVLVNLGDEQDVGTVLTTVALLQLHHCPFAALTLVFRLLAAVESQTPEHPVEPGSRGTEGLGLKLPASQSHGTNINPVELGSRGTEGLGLKLPASQTQGTNVNEERSGASSHFSKVDHCSRLPECKRTGIPAVREGLARHPSLIVVYDVAVTAVFSPEHTEVMAKALTDDVTGELNITAPEAELGISDQSEAELGISDQSEAELGISDQSGEELGISDQAGISKRSSCVNKRESKGQDAISWVPFLGTFYNLVSSAIYTRRGCTDVAKQRALEGYADMVLDAVSVATVGTGAKTLVKAALTQDVEATANKSLRKVTEGISEEPLEGSKKPVHGTIREVTVSVGDGLPPAEDSVTQVTVAPTLAKDEQTLATDEPILRKETPILTTDEPILRKETPILTTDEPILRKETPTLTTDEPILRKETPILTTDVPILSKETPILTTDEPILRKETPILTTDEPILRKETPTLTTNVPSLTTTSPTLKKDSSTLTTEVNNAVKIVPVVFVAKTVPSVAKTVPSVAKTVPSVAKTVPSVAKTVPSVAKTVPSVAKTVPSVAKTVPSVAKTVPTVAKTVPSVAKTVPSVAKTVPSVAKTVPSVAKTVPSVAKTVPSVAKTFSSVPGTASVAGNTALVISVPSLARTFSKLGRIGGKTTTHFDGDRGVPDSGKPTEGKPDADDNAHPDTPDGSDKVQKRCKRSDLCDPSELDESESKLLDDVDNQFRKRGSQQTQDRHAERWDRLWNKYRIQDENLLPHTTKGELYKNINGIDLTNSRMTNKKLFQTIQQKAAEYSPLYVKQNLGGVEVEYIAQRQAYRHSSDQVVIKVGGTNGRTVFQKPASYADIARHLDNFANKFPNPAVKRQEMAEAMRQAVYDPPGPNVDQSFENAFENNPNVTNAANEFVVITQVAEAVPGRVKGNDAYFRAGLRNIAMGRLTFQQFNSRGGVVTKPGGLKHGKTFFKGTDPNLRMRGLRNTGSNSKNVQETVEDMSGPSSCRRK